MKSARYPKPRERRVALTSVAPSTDGGGKGWYACTEFPVESDGSGRDTRGGEYCLHRLCTIFVIRAMLLLEEQMNLRFVEIDRNDQDWANARYEILPRILAQHTDSLEPIFNASKHRVTR